MERATGGLREWAATTVFTAAAAYSIWNAPEYVVGFGYGSEALATIKQPASAIDYAVLLLTALSFCAGLAFVRRDGTEFEDWGLFDRFGVFLCRVTMVIVASVVGVMFYEVLLRYVFEAPTLWANELSLWLAGMIYLLAGLYAMQQRSHIRIFLLYDVCPRPLRRTFDVISTILVCVFAIAVIYGGFNEAHDKFLRWETFGTAFDPPIPATMKPLVLITCALMALQAISNLINDWSREPQVYDPADDL